MSTPSPDAGYFKQVMKTMDHLSPETGALKDRLVHSVRKVCDEQGISVEDEMITRAAMACLTDPQNSSETASRQAPAILAPHLHGQGLTTSLSPEDIHSFFRLPDLKPNADERAAKRKALLNPKRWGKNMRNIMIAIGLTVASWTSLIHLANWNQQHNYVLNTAPWHNVIYLIIFAVLMVTTGSVFSLLINAAEMSCGDAPSDHNTRSQAAYLERLNTLSPHQLAQVHAFVLFEERKRPGQMRNAETLVRLVNQAIHRRDPDQFVATPGEREDIPLLPGAA